MEWRKIWSFLSETRRAPIIYILFLNFARFVGTWCPIRTTLKKRRFILTISPILHSNPSQIRSFWKTLFNSNRKSFWNAGFAFFSADGEHLKTKLFENDYVRTIMLFLWTELKKRLRMRHLRPSRETVGAKISTWTTHPEWKTLESLDFAVKFQLVLRYETVVFRRYVLALLLVVLLRKVNAYQVYLSLIWGKFPRRFSCFQKFRLFSYMFPGFPARISDMRNRFSALSFLCQVLLKHKFKITGDRFNIDVSFFMRLSCYWSWIWIRILLWKCYDEIHCQ